MSAPVIGAALPGDDVRERIVEAALAAVPVDAALGAHRSERIVGAALAAVPVDAVSGAHGRERIVEAGHATKEVRV